MNHILLRLDCAIHNIAILVHFLLCLTSLVLLFIIAIIILSYLCLKTIICNKSLLLPASHSLLLRDNAGVVLDLGRHLGHLLSGPLHRICNPLPPLQSATWDLLDQPGQLDQVLVCPHLVRVPWQNFFHLFHLLLTVSLCCLFVHGLSLGFCLFLLLLLLLPRSFLLFPFFLLFQFLSFPPLLLSPRLD